MNAKSILIFAVKWLLLTVLFLIAFLAGATLFPPELPTGIVAEPGPLPAPWDFLAIGLASSLVVILVLVRSRWYGWKLAAAASFAYYGLVSFMTQIETAYFLTSLTVSLAGLISLFLMGIPVALLFIPLAMLILGKWKRPQQPDAEPNERLVMPLGQWAWKLAAIAIAYALLYFAAGYFIAWQNPELRAFYHGEDPGSFFLQMAHIFRSDPWLTPFQLMRALMWTLFALPVIRMTRGKPWQAALIVGLLLSVPQNVGHLLPNPLIPANSVRISHMIETASSTFVFGLIMTWLLHRSHHSLADLFGLRPAARPSEAAASHV